MPGAGRIRALVGTCRFAEAQERTFRLLVGDLDLVHGVDPFLRRPVGRGLRSFRLHGRPASHYRNRYTDADLRALQAMLSRP